LYSFDSHIFASVGIGSYGLINPINVAAHELRAPTQSIMGYSELLKMLQSERNYDDYGITKEGAIDAISRNAIRLRHLTNEILDAS
jgi:signal transduction histidine kinase